MFTFTGKCWGCFLLHPVWTEASWTNGKYRYYVYDHLFFLSVDLHYIYLYLCVLSKDKHFLTSPKYSGLDLPLAQKKLEELVKKNVLEEVCYWNVTLYAGYLISKKKWKFYFQNILLKLDFSQVEIAVLQLLPSLDKKTVGVEGLRIYLILNELLHVAQKHKLQPSIKLAVAVAGAMQRLSAESRQIIGTERYW